MGRAFASPNVARLVGGLAALRARYESALPFRHLVIDDFFAPETAEALHLDFPTLAAGQLRAARLLEARAWSQDARRLGPALRGALAALGDAPFTNWLRALSGVGDARMDPINVGGGAHQGVRGSSLHVHADPNTHPGDPSLYRRINVLIYLNPNWMPAWGGELELWDERCVRVVRTIEPRFNRCVIAEVHDRAFHGYRRLQFPDGEKRESLAAYYYSASPAALQTRTAHTTLFGIERGERYSSRIASRMRQALLARMFPHLQGLPTTDSIEPKPGDRSGVSAMASDIREGLVESGQDRVAMDLEQ